MPFTVTRRLGFVLLLAAYPLAANAFIDERTPAPPPVVAPVFVPAPAPVSAPAQPAPMVPAVTPAAPALAAVAPAVIVATSNAPIAPAVTAPVQAAPQAVAFQPGVMGDIQQPIWGSVYPGPYGTMPLADALIAQVVPVVGKAIELNGSPMLLDQKVTLPRGHSRLETLTQMARTYNLGIMIQGNSVSLAGPDTPSRTSAATPLGMATERVRVADLHSPANVSTIGVEPSRPLVITKTWTIEAGTMLSSAVLDWAQAWGWKLIWKADVDYRIAAPIVLNAEFLDGVGQVLDAYKNGNRPLWGDWNDSQKILIVREPSSRDR